MRNANRKSQCDCLVDAGLRSLILLPESDAYGERQASCWAVNVALRRSCIVQPRTSGGVSRIIKVLANTDGPVALHSSGHTQWVGSNDVNEGITLDLGLYRLACDTAANFEALLANGDIVNANVESHSDLWTALKAHDIWGDIRVSDRSEGDCLAQIMIEFIPSAPDFLVAHIVVDTASVVNSPAFSQTQKVAAIVVDVEKRSMANMSNSYLVPSNQHQVWFSLTFKNDLAIIKHASAMRDGLVEDLNSLLSQGSFMNQCLFQPLPTLFATRSITRGGNVLGLDKVPNNALLLLITGATETSQRHTIMR
ncbi:hypothetical protein BDU57DRAFT_560521 [Ampelomyces quisqualis]|uniref:Uncharacterized protein n=1 Tax=Ampelomyces quisqualis TaxID=50730 RepID=A0A6A5Q9M0_AMPQU|nr:hypothetical protein BDU57DRAFT_560521 [Ampelomyces quisqualis]